MYRLSGLKYFLLVFLFLILPVFFPAALDNRSKLDNLPIPLNNYLVNSFSDFKYSSIVDNELSRFMDYNGLHGVSLAVVKDERLVFAKGYGLAITEDSIPTAPGTVFRLASVSKLISAVAIMKLAEEKKLALSDKVFGAKGFFNEDKYLDIKDKRLEDVTIHNLLNHSGGWTQRYGDPMFNLLQIAKLVGDTPPVTFNSLMKFVLSRNLHFSPGEAHSYSNLGYFFLGEIINRVTQQPFDEYIKNEILSPMGIFDIQLANNRFEERFPNEAKYYLPYGDSLILSYTGDSSLVSKMYGGNDVHLLGTAGGWVASAPELAKFMVSIDGFNHVPDFLSKASIAQMTQDKEHFLGWKQEYRDGWLRTGSFAGTQAVMFRGNDGFSWVFLCNTSSWKAASFSYDVIRLMNKIEHSVKYWPDIDLFNADMFAHSASRLPL
ncbi:MAG: beta-lactamase family protein [Bacteroidales bacterium]|nr:beta-lactamase family protein [Bacteroidales bacterium]